VSALDPDPSALSSPCTGHYYFSDCFGSAFVSFNPFPPVSFVSDPTSTDQGKVYVANDAESIMDQYDEVGPCLCEFSACSSD
jgi:hypothetical protein